MLDGIIIVTYVGNSSIYCFLVCVFVVDAFLLLVAASPAWRGKSWQKDPGAILALVAQPHLVLACAFPF